MENRFLKNKIIIKYCKDYYKIINEEINEKNTLADKLIQIYQAFIFSIDEKNKNAIKVAVKLNDAVNRYFEDCEYKKILTNHLKSIKSNNTEEDTLVFLVKNIIQTYNKYMSEYTRNIYIPKWI